MNIKKPQAILIPALLFVSSAFSDVIFSRRVYKEHGDSYQQIFLWNAADGALKQLSHSRRDHYRPTCNGQSVQFTSPSPALSDDGKLWSFNPATSEEHVIGRAPPPDITPDRPSHSCAHFAKAGLFRACGNDETLVVSRAGKQIGRFQIQVNTCPIDTHGTIGKCETPIRSLAWSEDGKWLLIGEQGLNDGSGQRQNDYYLFNVASVKISVAASAETAFWLPGRDQILYVTPQALAALPGQPKHNVWVQQLMFFDPVKLTRTAITSGVTNNVDPSWCEGPR